MRRALLQLLGMGTLTRGTMPQRPDQGSQPPVSVVPPSQAAGTLRARSVILFGTSVNVGLFVYTGTPALGNPPQIAIVPNTTTQDPFGNAITTSKILMQANVITETGGIFRTAAAAPLIQLDGPHDALLIYNAAAALIDTIAPALTSDGLGNTVYPGHVTYGSNIIAQLDAGGVNIGSAAQIAGTGGAAPGRLLGSSLSGITSLTAGKTAAGDADSTFQVISKNGNGGIEPIAILAQALVLGNVTPAGPEAAAALYSSAGNAKFLGTDGNQYGTGRLLQQVSPRSQTISSTTPGNVSGPSASVVAGTYIVRSRLIIQWSSAVGGVPGMRFAGPAVSQFDVSFKSQQSGTNSTTNNVNQVSAAAGNGTGYNGATLINLSTAMSNTTTLFDVDIWGMFTFTATGTLTLQAATSVANENFIVLSGFWEVLPL